MYIFNLMCLLSVFDYDDYVMLFSRTNSMDWMRVQAQKRLCRMTMP